MYLVFCLVDLESTVRAISGVIMVPHASLVFEVGAPADVPHGHL